MADLWSLWHCDSRSALPSIYDGSAIALVAVAVLRFGLGVLPVVDGMRAADIHLVVREAPLVVAADVALVAVVRFDQLPLSRHKLLPYQKLRAFDRAS